MRLDRLDADHQLARDLLVRIATCEQPQNLALAIRQLIEVRINGVVGARIEDNDVIAYPDQKSWIRADGVTNVEISNNRSTAYASRTPAGVKFKDNKTLRPAKKDRKERILEWVQRKDSPPQPENRLFHRILSEAGD